MKVLKVFRYNIFMNKYLSSRSTISTQVKERVCQDVTSEECTTVKERICDEVFEEECTVQEEEVGLIL